MTGPGPVPGTLEWTAQAAQGLVPPDPFAQLPADHRPKSRPLSVIFRVDAVDTPDARAQLEEVIVTAQAMLAGLAPPTGNTGTRPGQVVHLPGPARPAPPPRPWDDDPRGMGE